MTARTVQPALTDPPLVSVHPTTGDPFLGAVVGPSGPEHIWVRDQAGRLWRVRNTTVEDGDR